MCKLNYETRKTNNGVRNIFNKITIENEGFYVMCNNAHLTNFET